MSDENVENTLDRLRAGSRVRVLANHSCLTAAQHSHYNVLEGENCGPLADSYGKVDWRRVITHNS